MNWYPIKFEPVYVEKVWGGRAMEGLGRALPAGKLVGESWELADLSSNGAAGAVVSRVANGELAGATLRELIERHGAGLIGSVKMDDHGQFPLLLKYLDLRGYCSVQVHPSAAYDQGHALARHKTEAWYVVEADSGACVYHGLRRGVTRNDLSRAMEGGWVESLLRKWGGAAGDFYFVAGGTCHAMGGGLVVAEVQTTSDTTYRLYDWGREARTTHAKEALECVDFTFKGESHGKPGDWEETEEGVKSRQLVECDYFIVREFAAESGTERAFKHTGEPTIWMFIRGGGRVVSDFGAFDPVKLGGLETFFFPAAMNDARVELKKDSVWLEVGVPGKS